jgi:hypothetical protein
MSRKVQRRPQRTSVEFFRFAHAGILNDGSILGNGDSACTGRGAQGKEESPAYAEIHDKSRRRSDFCDLRRCSGDLHWPVERWRAGDRHAWRAGVGTRHFPLAGGSAAAADLCGDRHVRPVGLPAAVQPAQSQHSRACRNLRDSDRLDDGNDCA